MPLPPKRAKKNILRISNKPIISHISICCCDNEKHTPISEKILMGHFFYRILKEIVTMIINYEKSISWKNDSFTCEENLHVLHNNT